MMYDIRYVFIPPYQTVSPPLSYEGSVPAWGATAAQALTNSGIKEVPGTGLNAVQVTSVFPANPTAFVV